MDSKSINLCFQIHQSLLLKKYRFFDIGYDTQYFDDLTNRTLLHDAVSRYYMPFFQTLLRTLQKEKGTFKVSLAISGTLLWRFQRREEQVISILQELSAMDNVEFLCETFSHSLASLYDETVFISQVEKQKKILSVLFEQTPKVFQNTEFIYSDHIGELANHLGFEGILTEGAERLLGQGSPNFVHSHPKQKKLKLLKRNVHLSEDFVSHFNDTNWEDHALSPSKYAQWLAQAAEESDVINLFLNYAKLCNHSHSQLLSFIEAFPQEIKKYPQLSFSTPSETLNKCEAVSEIRVVEPSSWGEGQIIEGRVSNDMQRQALESLYSLSEKMQNCRSKELQVDWENLQCSNHFLYMNTQNLDEPHKNSYHGHYSSPFVAFTNYMNVLADFERRVQQHHLNRPLSSAIQKQAQMREEKEMTNVPSS